MDDYEYKYIHNLSQFVTTLNSRENCLMNLIPKKCQEFRLSVHSVQQATTRINPKFKIGDRVRISKYDFFFRNGYKPQFSQEVFEIVAISSRKPTTYTIKDEQDEFLRSKFYQKELIQVL